MHPLDYVRAFLTDRSFRVRVGSSNSTAHPVNSGVPQGSVPSLFLSNLVLAGIVKCTNPRAKDQVHVALYADNIALFMSFRTTRLSRSIRTLQAALNYVVDYLRTIVLSGSPDKTEARPVYSLGYDARSCATHLHVSGPAMAQTRVLPRPAH